MAAGTFVYLVNLFEKQGRKGERDGKQYNHIVSRVCGFERDT